MVPCSLLYQGVFRRGIRSSGEYICLYCFYSSVINLWNGNQFFRFAGKSEEPDKVYSTSIISLFTTSALFVLVILMWDDTIASWMDYSNHVEYIRWFGIIVAIDAFTAIPFARLRLSNRPIRFAVIKMANIMLNIGFNIFFISFCPYWLERNPSSIISVIYSADIGVGYVFISNLLASVITLIFLIPELIAVPLVFQRQKLKEMLDYGFPILLVGFAGVINQSIDKVLLKELLPDEVDGMAATGIYGANYKLGVLMAMFIQAFRYAFEPFFFSQKDGKDTKQMYADILKYFVIFGLLIFLGITFYLDIIKYLLGGRFQEGLHIVPWILMAHLFLGIFYTLSLWYKLTDNTRFGAYLAIMGAAITLVLNFVLVPVIGYIGAAMAAFVCYFAMTIVSYIIGQKYYPVPYNLKRIVFYMILALVIFGISYILYPEKCYCAFSLKYRTNRVFYSCGCEI